MAPLTTLVTAAVVLLLVWGRPAPTLRRALPVLERSAPLVPPADVAGDDSGRATAGGDSVALWLDGAEVDVDPAVAAALVAPEAEAEAEDSQDSQANEANEANEIRDATVTWGTALGCRACACRGFALVRTRGGAGALTPGSASHERHSCARGRAQSPRCERRAPCGRWRRRQARKT